MTNFPTKIFSVFTLILFTFLTYGTGMLSIVDAAELPASYPQNDNSQSAQLSENNGADEIEDDQNQEAQDGQTEDSIITKIQNFANNLVNTSATCGKVEIEGNCFNTIADAVNYSNANPSADPYNDINVINVAAGTYSEGSILVTEPVHIVGEGRNLVTVDSTGHRWGFEIQSDLVNIEHMTITGAGIPTSSNSGNVGLTGNDHIHVFRLKTTRLSHAIGSGIVINSPSAAHVFIYNSEIINNAEYGMKFQSGAITDYLGDFRIQKNLVSGNRIGAKIGRLIQNFDINDNQFINNDSVGLYLSKPTVGTEQYTNVDIFDNDIYGNGKRDILNENDTQDREIGLNYWGSGLGPDANKIAGVDVPQYYIIQGASYIDLQELIDQANPGDTVTIPAGSYNDYLYINKPLTLQGEGPGQTILDFFGTGITHGLAIQSDNVRVSDLTITNAGDGDKNDAAIRVGEAGGDKLKKFTMVNVHLVNNDSSGITFRHEDAYVRIIIADSVISNNTHTGILMAQYVEGIDNVRVKNTEINNNNIGIELTENADEFLLLNSTLKENVHGLFIRDNGDIQGRVMLRNNEVFNNSGYDILNVNSVAQGGYFDARYNYWGSLLGPFGLNINLLDTNHIILEPSLSTGLDNGKPIIDKLSLNSDETINIENGFTITGSAKDTGEISDGDVSDIKDGMADRPFSFLRRGVWLRAMNNDTSEISWIKGNYDIQTNQFEIEIDEYDIEPGTYRFRVRIFDNVFNVGSQNANRITVESDSPIVDIATPIDTSGQAEEFPFFYTYLDSDVPFQAEVSDSSLQTVNYVVTYLGDNSEVINSGDIAVNGGTYQIDEVLSLPMDGEYELTLTGTDAAGNDTAETIRFWMSEAPILKLIEPSDGEVFTEFPYSIGFRFQDDYIETVRSVITWNGEVIQDVTRDFDADGAEYIVYSSWTEISGLFSDGVMTHEFTVTDDEGNSTTRDVTFTVDISVEDEAGNGDDEEDDGLGNGNSENNDQEAGNDNDDEGTEDNNTTGGQVLGVGNNPTFAQTQDDVDTEVSEREDSEVEANEEDVNTEDDEQGNILGEEDETNDDTESDESGEQTEDEGLGINWLPIILCLGLLIAIVLLLLFLANRRGNES